MPRRTAWPLAIGVIASLAGHIGGGAALSLWGDRLGILSPRFTSTGSTAMIPLLSADSTPWQSPITPPAPAPSQPETSENQEPEPPIPQPPPEAAEIKVGNPASSADIASAWIGGTEALDKPIPGELSTVDQPELSRTIPEGGEVGGAPAPPSSELVAQPPGSPAARDTPPAERPEQSNRPDSARPGSPLGVLPSEDNALGAPEPREGADEGERENISTPSEDAAKQPDDVPVQASPTEGFPSIDRAPVEDARAEKPSESDLNTTGIDPMPTTSPTEPSEPSDPSMSPPDQVPGASGLAPSDVDASDHSMSPMPGDVARAGDEPGAPMPPEPLGAVQVVSRAVQQLAISSLAVGFADDTQGTDPASSVGDQPVGRPPASPNEPAPVMAASPTAAAPTPPSSADGSAGGAQRAGSADGDPIASGMLSDRDAIASAIRQATEVRPGMPLAAKGIDIKTVRPRFSHTTAITIKPRNPVVRVFFGADGMVQRHQLLRSSGHPDVDRPILDAIYKWTAEGEVLSSLGKPDKPMEIWFDVKILL